MKLFFEIFGLEVGIYLIPVIAGAVVSIVAAITFYFYYFRPKTQQPLPNERQIGWVGIFLLKGFGFHAGYMSTAQKSLQRWLATIIEKEPSTELKLKYSTLASFMNDRYHAVAHKVDRSTYIYLFNQDPMDQRFMDIDPTQNDAYVIHGVQDVVPAGEVGGVKFLGISLDTTTTALDEKRLLEFKVVMEVASNLKDAATNTYKIQQLKQENDDLRGALDKELGEKAKISSELYRAKSALAKETLTPPPTVALPGALGHKLKSWFTWPQFLIAGVAYLMSGQIMVFAGLGYLNPPYTTVLSAFITLVGFFILPVGKKLFGRWL